MKPASLPPGSAIVRPDVVSQKNWPFSASIDDVLYCHATPHDDTTMTTVFTPDDVVRASFGGVDERVVVIGHTHHQFERRAGEVPVVMCMTVPNTAGAATVADPAAGTGRR